MNENQLSKRLERAGELVPFGSRLADIGSDHAYLPVALMLQGKIEFAVAGEVVQGPFQSAEKQVRKNGLSEKIIVRLADGLDAVLAEDHINAVSICGMGGTLIRDILEKGRVTGHLNGQEVLILQPNVGEQVLRQWLTAQGYTILAEDILEENQKIYEIICAEKKEAVANYSEEELMFGPLLLQKKGAVFIKKWQREINQRKNVVEQLKKSKVNQQEKIADLEKEIKAIEEVLKP
ncbi:tRNA (adenine(22)-N(1))-methyltransferase [Enterococcus sp. BWR-S5]|uniref:tRNA (adenine(22)-N(1))-methyltransferase n=1 Tax=Enterococcus sp. BWR-S5 TaxID=2787714 RepID=UPI001923CE2A|nr:tRNA (adenine(22)-N(1))-methyltransferase TrmK [Enterococcus sp. BWR-S5]MBL1225635.1 tRNA (adenine-N(1))-methyltransferase [Enterococcus sp. BWR-S5]